MTTRAFVAALALGLLAASCGTAGEPGSAPDPDRPVQGPAAAGPADPPDPAACERLSTRLRGRALEDGQELARRDGCAMRVIAQDGRSLPVTDDFSPSRINVRVDAGVITRVQGMF